MSRDVIMEPMTMQPSHIMKSALGAVSDIIHIMPTAEHFTLLLPKGLVTEGPAFQALTEAVKTLEEVLPVIVVET